MRSRCTEEHLMNSAPPRFREATSSDVDALRLTSAYYDEDGYPFWRVHRVDVDRAWWLGGVWAGRVGRRRAGVDPHYSRLSSLAATRCP